MEAMKWPEGVSVAVNFSPQQFHQRDVLSEVRYALEVSGLPAHRLESRSPNPPCCATRSGPVMRCRNCMPPGCESRWTISAPAIPASATCTTSHCQKVKIDRSFLEGIDSDRPLTLLRGVARLSADLGMSVVVEGIETNEQLELISADGTVTERKAICSAARFPRRGCASCSMPRMAAACRTTCSTRFPAAPSRKRTIFHRFAF